MPPKDNRVTMKLDRALWQRIEDLVRKHPEWGMISVPDFIRRAIDAEIRSREEAESNRAISLSFSPLPDTADKRRRAP